jgi:amino acid transporter
MDFPKKCGHFFWGEKDVPQGSLFFSSRSCTGNVKSAWNLAFVVASAVALFVGISYVELSSKFPKPAREAIYVDQAFQNKYLNILVGYAVSLTGILTAAVLLKGFHGRLSSVKAKKQ